MFIRFFFLLRERGLNPYFDQWMTLMEALERNLADSGLTAFYELCRCILLNSEADFDKFDEVFLEFFSKASNHNHLPNVLSDEIPQEIMNFLTPDSAMDPKLRDLFFSPEHLEILKRLEASILRILKAMEEQIDKGRIGSCIVCVACGLCMRGMRGKNQTQMPPQNHSTENDLPKAALPIEEMPPSALSMAGARRFRDFREDTVLDIRQFQLAFRKLRQYSSRVDLAETEFDIDRTIDKTAQNAGLLNIVFSRPRKNSVKLLVLFDSDGSMWSYSQISNRLFQAVNNANHFKDLQFYYFHNCVYNRLFTSPACINGEWEDLDHILKKLDSDYRLIIVGDASMADSELFQVGGNVLLERSNRYPGIEYLKRLQRRYRKAVWLNPLRKQEWNRLYGGKTIQTIRTIFPMYELTVNGLDRAIKKLLVS